MKACGYNVQCRLLNSKWLGVPQARERVIFIGVRNDVGLEPVYPTPLSYYYTVADAFYGIKNDDEEIALLYDSLKGKRLKEISSKLPLNPKRTLCAAEVENGSWFNLKRLSMNEPSCTLLAESCKLHTAGAFHPLENRKLTIAELKRLQSLPDDFVLTGEFDQQAERIGRMVPPVMMMYISKAIQNGVLDKYEK